ncbi:Glycosyltransferase involved in cell wall bisynthesis [Flavobacterium swingsii]|jgi:glycosyltransferase involved in cell wall biosynthesis|uniref:Glycosyltransferase involved in cell wall bisynthesis n=1 Tax=Flavobacterium swingsii TaxID=498292 RepID=A0A1I0V211_9FLAO|nr:glycosyltransferase [Flavobacterium swingsii]SFA70120.1 Glycosyltransferase involved in cell wall bisynthesis [Flavobacterium swingsii]
MKISVAVCTYNGEQFIKEQIDSILNQSLPVDEIIVCDDRSKDRTIEILEEYSSLNPGLFKIYVNEKNLRSVKNFEKAISLCTGDIIFLSDQDDIWVNNKVADYIDYFNNHPNINTIASNGFCIDDNSTVIDKHAIWDVPQFLREKNQSINYYHLITRVANLATGASMAFKKDIINDIIPFPIIKGFHHDEWIAIISSSKNNFELLNKKYFYYRIHDKQQVGGVFYDKTDKQRKMLTDIFNLYDNDLSLLGIKRQLRKLCEAYKKNNNLKEKASIQKKVFEENLLEIEKLFDNGRKQMKKNYPKHFAVLRISDKFLNKRQLKNG